jgi:hypothetical protein
MRTYRVFTSGLVLGLLLPVCQPAHAEDKATVLQGTWVVVS